MVKNFDTDEPALSMADVIIGTPHFLAPESIRGASAVDLRTDLYSLGAVGYFLLTGRFVFEGDSVMEVCGHHLHTQPIAVTQRAQQAVPAALGAVIMRCLEKEQAKRPQNALELASELAACGVPEWSKSQIKAWWERRHQQQGAEPKTGTALQRTPTLLEVDVRARARFN